MSKAFFFFDAGAEALAAAMKDPNCKLTGCREWVVGLVRPFNYLALSAVCVGSVFDSGVVVVDACEAFWWWDVCASCVISAAPFRFWFSQIHIYAHIRSWCGVRVRWRQSWLQWNWSCRRGGFGRGAEGPELQADGAVVSWRWLADGPYLRRRLGAAF